MSRIICLADGVPFSSTILRKNPLGGAETACVRFLESLAAMGHEVIVYNSIPAPEKTEGVTWLPLSTYEKTFADVAIAHRSPHLLSRYPIDAPRHCLYVHNPTDYISKWKHRRHCYRHRPDIIFSGHYHASTWPKWLPKTHHLIIPYAVDTPFLETPARTPPPPKAIFISNPLRGLDWVLTRWANEIHPAIPHAEFHLYCGPGVYPGLTQTKIDAMEAVLGYAKALADKGVILHQPLPRSALINALNSSRVMLYRGDPGESFCLSLAEAQALGVPAVIQDIGACKERIYPNETGFVASDAKDFAAKSIALLKDDALWQTQHHNALHLQRRYRWADAAAVFDDYLKCTK